MTKKTSQKPKIRGPRLPLINPKEKPCEVCGKPFWHESFHRRRMNQQHRQRKTCSIVCRYRLMKINNPPEWRERYYGKTSV